MTRTAPLAVVAGLALATACSTKPLQGNAPDGGEADCTGLGVPAIACAVGPTVTVCSLDERGTPKWIILCPGEGGDGPGGSGGATTGAGGRGGSGGAAGIGGAGVGSPCASTESCTKGLVCTTEDGDCKSPPGCGANVACPAVCYGVCRNTDTGPECGPSQCNKGEVCCNESCGICTPPGGGCTKQLCPKDPAPAPCNTDADCKVEADYCTGCDCRALGVKQSLPACPGPGVDCLLDPCFNKTAHCVNGGCVAQ